MSKRLAGLLAAGLFSAASAASAIELPFYVYQDTAAPANHYVPSGWMGDWGDLQVRDDSTESPQDGGTCIKITYSAQRTQGANWAGMYWQDPANNWGDKPGGYDLTGATKFVFWARGRDGGEKIDEFRVGGIPGEHFDSDVAYLMGPIELTQEWRRFEIDLGGKDLRSIKGGFMWSARFDDNKNGFVIYLDEMRFE
jgi:hypothetical protein